MSGREMVAVYRAANAGEGHLLRGMLEQRGIKVTISGESLAGAIGELPASALGPEYYPPALTGLRGSHDGSFEAAHAVAREGRSFPIPKQQTEATYDLVVVGGGISGLSAAKFFRDRNGEGSRILVLDNHDDFGGHAKRNEFHHRGMMLLSLGSDMDIEIHRSRCSPLLVPLVL